MRYLIVLFLVGCATTEKVWVKNGAGGMDFENDKNTCQGYAMSVAGMNPNALGWQYASCMRGHGWYLVDK